MAENVDLNAKVKELMEDSDTAVWIQTIGSESARISYQKHIAEYLAHRNLTIQQLIESFKKDQNFEIKKLQEFVILLQRRIAPSSSANYYSAIKSRMKYDLIPFVRDVKIPNRHFHNTIAEETTPTVDQVNSLLRNSKPSTQTIIALISYLGVRFKAVAGLKIADFPEMQIIDNKKIVFEKIPTSVRIRSELSKNRKGYQTFLIDNGCTILKNWLETRIQRGEFLSNDSLIIPTYCKTDSIRQKSNIISRRIYTVFNKVNFRFRPYALKGYFATQLMNSGIQQNLQTFFMGHTGPMQNEYTARRQMSAEQIELMRKLFKERIEPFLVPKVKNGNAAVQSAFKEFASKMGIEVEENNTTKDSIEKIAEKLAKQVAQTAEKMNKMYKKENSMQQKNLESKTDQHLTNARNIQQDMSVHRWSTFI